MAVWLDAHHDAMAAIQTTPSCIRLGVNPRAALRTLSIVAGCARQGAASQRAAREQPCRAAALGERARDMSAVLLAAAECLASCASDRVRL